MGGALIILALVAATVLWCDLRSTLVWLALLVTGVVTVVLWAVARPFRRLVSMVSLTREQFGGIVPGAGSGPMSKVWQRMRGGACCAWRGACCGRTPAMASRTHCGAEPNARSPNRGRPCGKEPRMTSMQGNG
jgi:hypothetical protein